jgi:hypothetical protein
VQAQLLDSQWKRGRSYRLPAREPDCTRRICHDISDGVSEVSAFNRDAVSSLNDTRCHRRRDALSRLRPRMAHRVGDDSAAGHQTQGSRLASLCERRTTVARRNNPGGVPPLRHAGAKGAGRINSQGSKRSGRREDAMRFLPAHVDRAEAHIPKAADLMNVMDGVSGFGSL